MKTFTAPFGYAITSPRLRFYNSAATKVGADVTAGIVVTPGYSYSTTVAVPAGAVIAEWDTAEGATATHSVAPDSADVLAAAVDFKADISALATSQQIANLNDFDPAVDTVARVMLVDTTTTNTDAGSGGGGSSAFTPETIAKFEASEQILTTATYVPIAGPVAIIPAPVDPEMITCYLDSQEITGGEDANLKIEVRLEETLPTIASAQYLINNAVLMLHQSATPGQYRIDLPRGLNFRIKSQKLFGVQGKLVATPAAGGSFNIVTAP